MAEGSEGWDAVQVDEAPMEIITVVLAGKSGSGKSTLLSNLVKEEWVSATKDLNHVVTKSVTVGGKNLKIVDIDMSCSKDKLETQQINVLVYCMPVSPGCKFHDGNPEIIESLFRAYDEEIWEHCVVVLTFSKLALDRINSTDSDRESTRTLYKEYIDKFQDLFCKELERKLQETSTPPSRQIDPHTIPVIQAGDTPQDPLLLGVTSNGEGWRDKILQAIISQRSRTNIKIKPSSVWKVAEDVGGAIKNTFYSLNSFLVRSASYS